MWLENSTVVTPITWNRLETDRLGETQTCLLTVMLWRNEGVQFSSVQSLSRVWLSVTHGLQHTRHPCPSPTPAACWNSCPLSWWCHPTISSSVVPFSSCLQSFPALGSFQMSQFFEKTLPWAEVLMKLVTGLCVLAVWKQRLSVQDTHMLGTYAAEGLYSILMNCFVAFKQLLFSKELKCK